MRLKSVSISNFRCFGPAPVTVNLDTVTTLVGGNGSGKTAVLEALARLFGPTQQARTLQPDDFHIPDGQRRDSAQERQLMIEARFEFPSLDSETSQDPSVPAVFEQMAVEVPGGMLFCRMRLTGTWTKTSSVDGTIESRLEWLRSSEEEPAEGDRSSVSARDRDRVRVFYVPAARDAARHFANSSGTLLHHLLRAIEWEPSIREAVEKAGETLKEAFATQPAVRKLNQSYEAHWGALYDEWLYQKPSLHLAARRIEDAVRAAHIVFNPTHGNSDHSLDRLSEGQQSLFYFAFLATMFEVQREVYTAQYSAASSGGETQGTHAIAFSYDRLQPAALTVFAVEEPENHLAPHYLGRIVSRLSALVSGGGAQLVLASHAPAVLARVEPSSVRYLRRDAVAHVSSVRALTLPAATTDAEKYVRQAVRAFPELYFARAVVLCEGDSEELLIPRFARLTGEDLDLAFVSVVPLGGRHVNHFWKLLGDLEIPFVTLLDLDRERESGGWERIHYIVVQLCAFLEDGLKAVLLAGPSGVSDSLDEKELSVLKTRDDADASGLEAWMKHLRNFDVYFSSPLDVDFLMLESYTSAYKATLEDGQTGPQSTPEQARVRVLGKHASAASYSQAQDALFSWYSYLFLGKGKPSTHTAAWIRLSEEEARSGIPEPIVRVLEALKAKLSRTEASETEISHATTGSAAKSPLTLMALNAADSALPTGSGLPSNLTDSSMGTEIVLP